MVPESEINRCHYVMRISCPMLEEKTPSMAQATADSAWKRTLTHGRASLQSGPAVGSRMLSSGDGVIVPGDSTTHGGKVVYAQSNYLLEGKPVAVVGVMVRCPKDGHSICSII